MKTVCIFCGSNVGSKPAYTEAAQLMGRQLAQRSMRLVYGGGNVGLMGVLADAALAAGTEVIGVIPDFLMAKEVGHSALTEMHLVKSMHERKQIMADLSDAFIAMPGGIGTLEELFEVFTWGQLGLHQKPLGLLNTAAYYDPLIEFLDQMVAEKFVRQENREMLFIDEQAGGLLDGMQQYHPPKIEKWIDRSKS